MDILLLNNRGLRTLYNYLSVAVRSENRLITKQQNNLKKMFKIW